ncbi:ESPR domain-containing protein, partial [Escherichia coli]
MNKIYKLVWNVAHGEWVVCSELGRKTKLGSLRSSLIIGALLLSQNAISAECSTNANGTITVNNSINTAGCSVESIGSEIGNTSIWNTGILQYSQGVNRNITILNDLSFTIKGSAGIAVGGTSPAYVSTFDASNKTIDLTIANLDTNAAKPEGDNIAKVGVGSSHGATVKIGTMNLTMLSLPNGTSYSERFEHYGVVAGSSVNAGEQENFNGMYSRALFDNLDINMASTNNTGFLASSYPLVVGIRAIQGASRNSGNGAAGYVSVSDTLNLNIKNGKNDAIGIYISGSEINNVTPQVHLHDSNIKIVSSSSRANAIRLGKSAAIGTGEGQLYSSGKMFLDTTEAPNDASIDIIWQGALLDANENTSRTEIKSGKEAITISGNASQATA